MMTREAVHALDRAAAAYAASQSDPIGAYHAYLAGALAALQQIRADLLAMPREETDMTNGTLIAARTITDEQIATLRAEAGAAGDLAQVAICDRALRGSAAARAECARVIADAMAQRGAQ